MRPSAVTTGVIGFLASVLAPTTGPVLTPTATAGPTWTTAPTTLVGLGYTLPGQPGGSVMIGDSLLFANGDTAASPSRLTVNRDSMFIGERGSQTAPLTQISRQFEAGVDLNGDGDGVDGFVVITVEGGAPQRHFSPGSCRYRVDVNLALYCRSEVDGDLNGDGDRFDQQVTRLLAGGSIEPTGVFLSAPASIIPIETRELPDGRYAWADTIFTAEGTQTTPIAGFTVVGMSSGSPVVCPSGTYGGCKLIPPSGQPVDVGSSLPTWTQVGTVFWITESELRLGDLNGDGDLLDEQLCRLSAAGAPTSCLDVRPRSSSQYPIISTGEDRGLVLGFSPSASPLHRLSTPARRPRHSWISGRREVLSSASKVAVRWLPFLPTRPTSTPATSPSSLAAMA